MIELWHNKKKTFRSSGSVQQLASLVPPALTQSSQSLGFQNTSRLLLLATGHDSYDHHYQIMTMCCNHWSAYSWIMSPVRRVQYQTAKARQTSLTSSERLQRTNNTSKSCQCCICVFVLVFLCIWTLLQNHCREQVIKEEGFIYEVVLSDWVQIILFLSWIYFVKNPMGLKPHHGQPNGNIKP